MQNFHWSHSQITYKVAVLFLAFASSTVLGVIGSRAQESKPAESYPVSERRALDPLTPGEQASAQRIALSDGKVKEILGNTGIRVVSVVPVVTKPESLEKLDYLQRQVEVVLFRPQGETGARVLVNLQHSSVVEVTRLAGDQVPMAPEDLADAFQLALRDSEVQKMLGPAAQSFRVQTESNETEMSASENLVTGLPLRSTDAKDPCSKHRCMELFFRRGTDYLTEPIVVVDLTAKHVYVERRKSK